MQRVLEGAAIKGVAVSIYSVLEEATKILGSTPEGKAVALAIGVVIEGLNALCGKPAGVP